MPTIPFQCDRCRCVIAKGAHHWELQLMRSVLKDGALDVQEAHRERTWCCECFALLDIDNLLVPEKPQIDRRDELF